MAKFKLGFMTLKSLFSKPATKLYPIEKPEYFDETKGHIVINPDGCYFCGVCANICPTGAIEVDKQEMTWAIDRFRCIQCRTCTGNCTKDVLYMDRHYVEPSGEHIVEVYTVTPEERERREKAAAEKAAKAAKMREEALAKKKAEKEKAAKEAAPEAPAPEAPAPEAPAAEAPAAE